MAHGKIVLHGVIELMSPTLIGSGSDDFTDIDVLLDTDGQPFIPATALVGALRHALSPQEAHKDFWGFTEKKQGRQSMLRCSDLRPSEGDNRVTISRRDGIKIDSRTGIVKDQGKYDYQVIERGACFELKLEVSYTGETSQTLAEQMLVTICTLLEKEEVRIGAKSNNGLGKIRLKDKTFYSFDFSNKIDVLHWLKQDLSQSTMLKTQALPIRKKEFVIEAEFDLKHSVIVRSYPSTPGVPDAVNVKSGDDYVLPGSSLKGAIRARAERILNTLKKDPEIFTQLFGKVDEENKPNSARKGKIRVEETLMLKYLAELHHRVKIDRFTGGTIESALFDTMPVYPNLNDKVLEITITVQDYATKAYHDYEAGLLLLVLKDLWTGDLTIGGEKSIGRGVLQGCRARIYLNGGTSPILLNQNFIPVNDEGQTDEDAKQELERLVGTLIAYEQPKTPGQGGIS